MEAYVKVNRTFFNWSVSWISVFITQNYSNAIELVLLSLRITVIQNSKNEKFET